MTVRTARSHKDAIGTKYRCAFKLLTAANTKTPKGEALGYLSAILYLAPHTEGGGATLCPHSTPACREMCLAGAGLSGLPRQIGAKLKRTVMFNEQREAFMATLRLDLAKLIDIATSEGLKPAARLNGTSDIMWERLEIMQEFPEIQFYDYTKVPLHHRRNLPVNYHLTFSIEGEDSMLQAVDYLAVGQSVAAVVDEAQKHRLLERWAGVSIRVPSGYRQAQFIDGDEHDLRFLDPPGSVVLLKPKGRIVTSLLREDILADLTTAAMASAS